MLRTIVQTTWGAIAHPTAPSTQTHRSTRLDARDRVPVGRGPNPRPMTMNRTIGAALHERASITTQVLAPTAAPGTAPWGELPELAGLAEVSTEPFPPEWWRRRRIAPMPASPFVAALGTARVDAVDEPAPTIEIVARPSQAVAPNATPSEAIPIGPTMDRAERRHRGGRFARLCLLVAGALISFIVVDAASGRTHR